MNGVTLEGPLAAGPDLRHVPLLAEEVPGYEAGTLSLDPFTVEVRLRQNVAFADGTPLTSADVRRTYEGAARMARDGEISPAYAGFGRLLRVETPDRRTARLVFREPYAAWRDLLTAPILSSGPEDAPPDGPPTGLPAGSGPFVPEENLGDGLVFAASPRYWASGPRSPLPKLDGLEVGFEVSAGAATALGEGRADFGFFPVPGAVPGSGDLLRAAAARTRTEVFVLDARSVGDEGLRRAIVRAVDRERVAGVAGAEPAEGFSAPAPEDEPHSGRPLRLVYPEGNPARAAVAEALVADLAAAGFEAGSRAVPIGEFYAEALPDGGHDLALYDVGTPAGYEAALPALPPAARGEFEEVLGNPDAEGTDLAAAATAGSSLVPLFAWPDAYAWSGTLYGPRPETPLRGVFWNAREWGFYR